MPDGWLFETAQVKLPGGMFTVPTWRRGLVLLISAVLSPGRRTVAAALRVTGLDQDPHFTNYHRVLNRSRWSSRRVARCLVRLRVSAFVPSGPVIIGRDYMLERRWGAKIAARGIAPATPTRCRSSRHPALVCPSLVHRGDLCRGPSPPRRRDATAVRRQSGWLRASIRMVIAGADRRLGVALP